MRIFLTQRIGYILNAADHKTMPDNMVEVCSWYQMLAEEENIFVPDFSLVTQIEVRADDILNGTLSEFLKIIDKRNTSLVIVAMNPYLSSAKMELRNEIPLNLQEEINNIFDNYGFRLCFKARPIPAESSPQDYLVSGFVGDTTDGFEFKHKLSGSPPTICY